MGTVEQDLARHQRELDKAEELDMAAEAIRDEITGDADALAELLVKALEGDNLQLTTIAKLMMGAKAARTTDQLSVITAETLAELHIAIEPYVAAEIEKRTPQRLRQWRREGAEDRAEAILESRAAYLYGDPGQ